MPKKRKVNNTNDRDKIIIMKIIRKTMSIIKIIMISIFLAT